MKVRVTKPDGTVIEAEGAPEECARFCGVPSPQPTYVFTPFQIVPVPYVSPYTVEPWVPTWTGTTVDGGAS